jgi:regulation of enolase protein 1 (concanavalin A-like superfamily)
LAVPWKAGSWTTMPVSAVEQDGRLLVTAAEGSDAWRRTAYGYINDNEHSLLEEWDRRRAVEVTFSAAFDSQFDQAGLMIRIDEERWIKAGVEYADGVLQLGAVVTDTYSDWSTGPVPEWAGRDVTVRASRMDDAVVVRARVDDEPWRLVRLAPFASEVSAQAGPFCCAPSRSGLTVSFSAWQLVEPDERLH